MKSKFIPRFKPTPKPSPFAGLDLLSTAVVLVDEALVIRYLNAGAENLFGISARRYAGQELASLLGDASPLGPALDNVLNNNWSYTGKDLRVQLPGRAETLYLDCTVSPVEAPGVNLLLEFRPIEAQLRVTREEVLLQQQQANRELIRNLAHEIKNPLGGIRGSAQLLEGELDDPLLKEYTQVIIAEADRLQALMKRLLGTHAVMHPAPLNIHDVLEHVRRLVLAEFPGLTVIRDYDTSLPDITGDREQLIQAVLNIARNAAQAVEGRGEITFRTRAARQVTLAKRRHKLALELQVIDNGPGIPETIRDQIFYPLVSGRDGGSGLGLSLAQGFVEQHQGMIDVDSEPGRTCFTLLLPVSDRS
ncbi:PAS domain-containing protein [Nitrogeniibacter mangrovi]|uniref:histidine kinase n=1 Tax=Nitrogeniibacter mangrovi TaxID=2016596 RepID=A0A6C1B573_9RHOO|nr:nitrogen regulation protein NR(II) [Nitrogeniibacter mangrovi]QID18866.1 PAS domain-containing protein [Nitrogeniibacter mangrovi]